LIDQVVTELLTSERLALSRDQYGATPLHKAVLFYQPKIVKLIAEKYRITTRAKDQVNYDRKALKCILNHKYISLMLFYPFQHVKEGRTPLHYAAALHDSGIFYRYLLKCGADEHIQDKVQFSAINKYELSFIGTVWLVCLYVNRTSRRPKRK
jgi:ankyrin repeat protein